MIAKKGAKKVVPCPKAVRTVCAAVTMRSKTVSDFRAGPILRQSIWNLPVFLRSSITGLLSQGKRDTPTNRSIQWWLSLTTNSLCGDGGRRLCHSLLRSRLLLVGWKTTEPFTASHGPTGSILGRGRGWRKIFITVRFCMSCQLKRTPLQKGGQLDRTSYHLKKGTFRLLSRSWNYCCLFGNCLKLPSI